MQGVPQEASQHGMSNKMAVATCQLGADSISQLEKLFADIWSKISRQLQRQDSQRLQAQSHWNHLLHLRWRKAAPDIRCPLPRRRCPGHWKIRKTRHNLPTGPSQSHHRPGPPVEAKWTGGAIDATVSSISMLQIDVPVASTWDLVPDDHLAEASI
ncbi:Hypothetical predicted protein [Pelobates cultripes]|uniref:Uncharacterized protein n=1 Tax=Pelobates cultripes TaxID=61616 RepID=A0AAD1RW35_PELCU|nr:Hypothetical predicted protein [Pelobates cultripes]